MTTAAANPPAPTRASAAPATTQPAPLLDPRLAGAVATLDETATKYAAALATNTLSRLGRSMMLAEAVDLLRRQIDGPVLDRLMKLMNSDLGFKTDRPSKSNPQPYSKEDVREAVIVGLLRGVYPFGNEMNIIADHCYVTQEGYRRKVREFPGVSDLVIIPGIPRADPAGQTVVRMAVSWKLHGKPGQLVDHEGKVGLPIAVPVHSSTGVDAIIGKAIRKALKRAYEQITGSIQEEEDEDARLLSSPSPEFTSQENPAAEITDPPPLDEATVGDLLDLIDQAGTARALHDARNKVAALAEAGRLSAAQQQQLSAALEARAKRK